MGRACRTNERGSTTKDGICSSLPLERREMKVNRRKTEYMCLNDRQVKGTVKMQGEEGVVGQECQE